jgi:hypothetical protein
MKVIPYYGLVMLPGIVYSFQDSYLAEIAGPNAENAKAGDRILFLAKKSDEATEKLTADDVYPIGMYGTVCEVRSDGMVSIHMDERVRL